MNNDLTALAEAVGVLAPGGKPQPDRPDNFTIEDFYLGTALGSALLVLILWACATYIPMVP